jgi:hypothetical protein
MIQRMAGRVVLPGRQLLACTHNGPLRAPSQYGADDGASGHAAGHARPRRWSHASWMSRAGGNRAYEPWRPAPCGGPRKRQAVAASRVSTTRRGLQGAFEGCFGQRRVQDRSMAATARPITLIRGPSIRRAEWRCGQWSRWRSAQPIMSTATVVPSKLCLRRKGRDLGAARSKYKTHQQLSGRRPGPYRAGHNFDGTTRSVRHAAPPYSRRKARTPVTPGMATGARIFALFHHDERNIILIRHRADSLASRDHNRTS